MLKKSYEDEESPCNYEDLDLFDLDKAKESLVYKFESEKDEEEQKEILKEINEENNLKCKTKGDFEVYLNGLDKDEIRDLCEEWEIYQDQTDFTEDSAFTFLSGTANKEVEELINKYGCDEDLIKGELDKQYPEDKFFILIDFIEYNTGSFHIRIWEK